MIVDANTYGDMRAWLAVIAPEVFPRISPESDPVRLLDAIWASSPANARKGLAMAINDIVEATDMWGSDRVAEIDERLVAKGLPSLSNIRTSFSRVVRRAVRRGHIVSEEEYYAIRNAMDIAEHGGERMWRLLDAYEQRQTSRSQ